MKDIRLNSEYVIGAVDDRSVGLFRVGAYSDKSKKEGQEKREIQGYFNNIEHAWNYFVELKLKADNDNIFKIIDEIKLLKIDFLKNK